MINWRVRARNKNFWLSIVPAVLVLVQAVAAAFGISVDVGEFASKIIAIVNAAFVVLAILGIVNDPTTDGISDSRQAMSYDKPNKG